MNVTSALRSIAGVDDSVTVEDDLEQQYEMYQKTLESLEDIDPDDENEGITVVTEWIMAQIETTGERPSSRECVSAQPSSAATMATRFRTTPGWADKSTAVELDSR